MKVILYNEEHEVSKIEQQIDMYKDTSNNNKSKFQTKIQ